MKKTLVKTGSWACVSGVLIFGSAFASTGLFTESLVAALTASLLKTPLYAAHEPIFDRVYNKLIGVHSKK